MKKRIIVFHGKSDLTARKKISQIIDADIPKEERDIAVTHFRNHEGKKMGEEVTEAIFSLPLGCTRQLVVIWQYLNFFSPSQLLKLIPLIPDNTWVVLVSNTSLNSSEQKKFSSLDVVEVITENFVKWDAIRHHLQRFFQNHELQSSREVMDHLVEFFSENPTLMEKELEKVAMYFNPGSRVTVNALQGILAEDHEEQFIYVVVNHFFEKKPAAILKTFRQYLDAKGDFSHLIAIMIKELILIVKFKEMKGEGLSMESIFRTLGIFNEKRKKSLLTKDALFKYDEITRFLQGFLAIDKGLKQESLFSLELARPRVSLKAKMDFERLVAVVMADGN